MRPIRVRKYYGQKNNEDNPVGGAAETVYNDEQNNYWVKNRVQVDTDNWAESITYFDGLGRRVKKVSATETVIFVYDAGGKLVAEYSTNPSQTPQVQYLTNDHLGTPRINTNENGAVVSRTDYMPYGEEIIGLGGRTTTDKYVSDDVRQGFTSYLNDEETGLDYAQARMYKKDLGRFTGADPMHSSAEILLPQTWHRYSYALNNPLLLTDPFGLWVWGDGFGSGKKEADLTEEERRNRNKFRESLETDRSIAEVYMESTDPEIVRRGQEMMAAVESYGGENVDNGVTLRIGEVGPKNAATTTFGNELGIRTDSSGNLVPDVIVTFRSRDTIDSVNVGHEGSHAYDRIRLAQIAISDPTASVQDMVNSSANRTVYDTERRAYYIGSWIAESLSLTYNANGTEFWNVGWKTADQEVKRANGIEKILKDSYGVTANDKDPKRIMMLKEKRQ